jgi:hypothetical protein
MVAYGTGALRAGRARADAPSAQTRLSRETAPDAYVADHALSRPAPGPFPQMCVMAMPGGRARRRCLRHGGRQPAGRTSHGDQIRQTLFNAVSGDS